MLNSHQWGFVAFTWEQFHSVCSATFLYNKFEIYTFKVTATSPRDQRVDSHTVIFISAMNLKYITRNYMNAQHLIQRRQELQIKGTEIVTNNQVISCSKSKFHKNSSKIMASILQSILSNALPWTSWRKIAVAWWIFQWFFFQIDDNEFSISLGDGMAMNRLQAIARINDDRVH